MAMTQCQMTGKHPLKWIATGRDTEPPPWAVCQSCGYSYAELVTQTAAAAKPGVCVKCGEPIDEHDGLVKGPIKCPGGDQKP